MGATQQAPVLAGYRDEVSERIRSGQRFGDVETAIDAAADLTTDQKAALWLFAFSLRGRDEQQIEARAHLAAVE